MDFGAIATVSGVTHLTTPPRVVTAVNAVDRDRISSGENRIR